MKTPVKIKKIVSWTIPYFGNRHTMPYGLLEVSDGVTTKTVRTKGDTLESFKKYGCQCITFNRKRYKLVERFDNETNKIKLDLVNI